MKKLKLTFDFFLVHKIMVLIHFYVEHYRILVLLLMQIMRKQFIIDYLKQSMLKVKYDEMILFLLIFVVVENMVYRVIILIGNYVVLNEQINFKILLIQWVLKMLKNYKWFTSRNYFEDFHCNELFCICRHPDDVDLFVGINHETSLPGALVGPVSACIIGTQFQHLKYGDRFFYTHEGEFTPGKERKIVFVIWIWFS